MERQRRAMAQAIREERLPEEERACHRRSRGRQAAITHEARPRLGWRTEEDDG